MKTAISASRYCKKKRELFPLGKVRGSPKRLECTERIKQVQTNSLQQNFYQNENMILRATMINPNSYLVRYLCNRKLSSKSNANTSINIEEESALDSLEKETSQLLRIIGGGDDSFTTTKTATTLMNVDKVMEEWSKQGTPEAAQRAEELLLALEHNYDCMVAEATCSFNDIDNASENDIGNVHSPEYNTTLLPNAISYNHVLHAYAQSNGGVKAAQRCDAILDRMLDRCRQYINYEQQTEQRRKQCVNAGHTTGNDNSRDQRITLVRPVVPAPEPLVTTFNTAMNAWSKSKILDAGSRAEEIFRKMERWNYEVGVQNGEDNYNINHNGRHASCYKGVQPNTRSLNIVIDAWANARDDRSFDRILAVLFCAAEKLDTIPKKEDDENFDIDNDHGDIDSVGDVLLKNHLTPAIPINTVIFNSVLNGLANSNRGREAAEKAEEILSMMQELHNNGLLQNQNFICDDNSPDEEYFDLKPNIRTWSLLLKCWANAIDIDGSTEDDGEYAATRTESILCKMEELHQNGEDTKPNAFSYTACIKAWSKCSSDVASKRAVSILKRMEEMSRMAHAEELKPNSIHYNLCLSGLCKKHRMDEANKLFDKMNANGVADTVSYNTMMKGHLSNADPANAHRHVVALYEQLKESKELVPDAYTFTTVINSWRKSSRESNVVDEIVKLLNHMIALCKKDPTFSPNIMCFTVALQAIQQSYLTEKVEPGRKIFHEMIALHEARNDDKMKPDAMIFSAFLSLCANQGGNRERRRFALKLALGTFEQLCAHPQYGKPNEFIYGNLIKACGRLTDDWNEKARLLEPIFKKCVNEGHLSKITFQTFLRSAPRDLKDAVLGGLPGQKIPGEWCRNVKINDRP